MLVQAVKVPPSRKGETGPHWRSRFSVMLIGLTADGAPDARVGPKGVVVEHVSHFDGGGFWLDGQGRPTMTGSYRLRGRPPGFAAIRFTPDR